MTSRGLRGGLVEICGCDGKKRMVRGTLSMRGLHPRNVLVSAALLLLASTVVPASLQAQSAFIAVDSFNRKIHSAGSASAKRSVGGLAKIATSMVTLDWAEASKVGVNVLATVPTYAPQMAEMSSLGLQIGDRLTLRDLIYATMMSSDNVAAVTLADFVGRDHLYRLGKQGDPQVEFVRQMNNLARREGAVSTRFTNPHGYENTRTLPTSTAADIARLALYAISRPGMRFYTNQSSRNITVYRGEQQLSLLVTNTNQLLGIDGIDGVKTGNTPRSGGCVVISAERPASVYKQPDGSSNIFTHRMAVVVLGSGDPFGEARAILHQAWGSYDQWMGAGRPIKNKREMLNHFQ